MKSIVFTIKPQINRNGFFLTLFLFLLFFGFSLKANAHIITSIKPIGFITEAIGHGVVKTDVLLPNGVSPHAYALKPTDIQKLKQADLVIWVGEDMEMFLPAVLSGIDKNKQLSLSDVPAIHVLIYHHPHAHNDKHAEGHYHNVDSHLWLSLKIARQAAIAIHYKLVKIYPNQKRQLDKNLNDFTNKLSDTEQIIAKKLINIQNRGYFVFHDAYGYFERRFGLKNLGHFTLNPEIQPGAKKVYSIRRQLIDNKAVCVFNEPQFNPTIINKVIDGTNVRTGTLDPLGSAIPLSKDAYFAFLTQLTSQFEECLSRDNQ